MIHLTEALVAYSNAVTEAGEHSAFWTDVNGRFYEDEAPEGAEYPLAVYSIITVAKEKNFSSTYRNLLIQIDLYSSKRSSAEIKQMYNDCSDFFDECSFPIIENDLIWLHEVNCIPGRETVITDQGTTKLWHWSVDFELVSRVNKTNPATFAAYLEEITADGQGPVTSDGTPAPSNKQKVTINGTEYWMYLDVVQWEEE